MASNTCNLSLLTDVFKSHSHQLPCNIWRQNSCIFWHKSEAAVSFKIRGLALDSQMSCCSCTLWAAQGSCKGKTQWQHPTARSVLGEDKGASCMCCSKAWIFKVQTYCHGAGCQAVSNSWRFTVERQAVHMQQLFTVTDYSDNLRFCT